MIKSAWMLELAPSRIQLADKVETEDAQITPLVDDYVRDDNNDQLLTQESDEQLNLELPKAIEAELTDQQPVENEIVEEIVLESSNIEGSEIDGVKIIPLPANTDAPFTHE